MASHDAISRNISRARAAELDELRKTAPALYWAMKYHINSRGEAMNFQRVPYLVELYAAMKTDHRQVVEKSVQCGLSELYIVNSHVEAAAGLSVMYVLPKYELRNRFVNNRIFKLHRKAAKYATMVRESGTNVHRTSLIHFGKGTIAYVGSNVESEFIEMPIDSAYVDEKDRCNLANLELLPDRYTASPYKFHREISNPTVEGFGIDARFQQSSQGLWNIRCPACKKWFNPDFFLNVVRQTGPRMYEPRDPGYDPEDEMQDIHLVCECGHIIKDRCMDGEYVHAFPKREWRGYRISKLLNKFTSLRDLYHKWIDAQSNDIKLQVCYNSDLGLPYSSKGARVFREDLERLKREYTVTTESSDYPRIIGVDVGADLNYVVREVVREGGITYLRLVALGILPTFELLCTEVLDVYKPRITVIDANPEIHKVQELKEKYHNVYSSVFQEGKLVISVNKSDRIVNMDRTALLDSVKANIEKELYINPMNSEFLDDGNYYAQMTASTRILDINEEHPDKSRFVWVHTAPDHYCFTGDTLVTTSKGDIPIKEIIKGDYVLTRHGFREVLFAWCSGISKVSVYTLNGISITATDSHKIWTEEDGMIELRLLTHKHTCRIINQGDKLICELSTKLKLYIKGLLSEGIQNQKEGLTGFILPQVLHFLRLELEHYIERYGKISLGIYLKGMTFIIRMGIHLTMRLRILNVLLKLSIIVGILLDGIKSIQKRHGNIMKKSKILFTKNYAHGRRQRTVFGNLEVMLNSCVLICSHMLVRSVGLCLKLVEKLINIAVTVVRKNKDELLELIMKKEFVSYAGSHLQSINIINRKPVRDAVEVYNLTVAEHHEYFANGILVSNCLTEGYCLQALALVPNIDSVIGFFRKNTGNLTPSVSAIDNLTPEQAAELERMGRISPEQALDNIRRKYHAK